MSFPRFCYRMNSLKLWRRNEEEQAAEPIDLRGQSITPEVLEHAYKAVQEQADNMMARALHCPWCHRPTVWKDGRWVWDCTCYSDRLRGDSR